ncbi:MAG: peroxide stress protein YaaA [Actinomycetota bacterium]
MPRPVVLIPPSKGKAEGGRGRAYARTLGPSHPLGPARRELLDAVVVAAPRLSARVLAGTAGVPAREAGAARRILSGLADAATMPAHRRYTGVVHGNAGLAGLDPASARADVRIVSALLGLAGLDDAVPAYRLEFAASLPGIGGIATFWRDRAGEHLTEVCHRARVWDLLPAEHARIWPAGLRDTLDVVTVRFVRPGGGAANAARTKLAKGRIVAHLLARPTTTPARLARDVELDAGWALRASGGIVTATFRG